MTRLNAWSRWITSVPQTKFINGLTLLMIILCCQQLALLSWRFIPDSSMTASMSTPNFAVNRGNRPKTLDMSAIQKLALFGQMPADKVAESLSEGGEGAQDNLPESRLNVRVTGIFASNLPELAIAIVDEGRQQVGYSIGEIISGTQARIIRIFADRIIVRRQGRDEVLYFSDAKKDAARSPVAANTINTSANTGSHSPPLSQLKETLRKEPAKIMDYLVVSPVMEDNQLVGYRLNPGRQAEYFKQVGLRNNDLAVSLNGFDLTDNAEAQKVMGQLDSLKSLNVTIERDGQLLDIHITLDEE